MLRTRFPCSLSPAQAIHKSEGSTYNQFVAKKLNHKEDHMHYVAFSCVRNLSDMQILEFNECAISVSQKVTKHMEILHNGHYLNCAFHLSILCLRIL